MEIAEKEIMTKLLSAASEIPNLSFFSEPEECNAPLPFFRDLFFKHFLYPTLARFEHVTLELQPSLAETEPLDHACEAKNLKNSFLNIIFFYF
jgi:hypothetical protein